MPVVPVLLHGVLAPAVACALVLLAGWRPWRKAPADGRWSGGLALGLAFFVAFALIASLPPLPFGDRRLAAQEWLAWLALGGGLALVVEPLLGRAGFLLRFAVAAAALVAVVPTRLWKDADRSTAEHAQLGLSAGLVAIWLSTEALARRARGASMPAALLVAGTALAVVLGLTGSAFLGQLAGALTAALGAALVLAWWRPAASLAGPGVATWAALHGGLALCGYFYSYTPAPDALLVGLAPLLAWAGELPAVRRRPAWQVVAARCLAVAIPAGAAVTRAALAYEPNPYDSY